MSDTMKLFPILVPGDVLALACTGELADTTTIVCGIPWSMIEPHELRVRRHHRKGLRAIQALGGLEAHEAVAAIDGEWLHWKDANARLCVLLAMHGLRKAA